MSNDVGVKVDMHEVQALAETLGLSVNGKQGQELLQAVLHAIRENYIEGKPVTKAHENFYMRFFEGGCCEGSAWIETCTC